MSEDDKYQLPEDLMQHLKKISQIQDIMPERIAMYNLLVWQVTNVMDSASKRIFKLSPTGEVYRLHENKDNLS